MKDVLFGKSIARCPFPFAPIVIQKLQLKKMSFATHSQFSFFSLLPLPCNLKNLAKKSEEEYPMFLNEGLLIFATFSGFFIM